MNAQTAPPSAYEKTLRGLIVVFGLAVLMWLLEIVDAVLFGQRLNALGILPRDPSGLPGILFAPMLHANVSHLASNTLPFVVLGGLIAVRSLRDFAFVTAMTWLISGMGAWLFGAGSSFHVGASGVVFGYFAFLVARGLLERKPVSVGVAVLVAVLYGGILIGLNPFALRVSWTAHLFGLAAGTLAAFLLSDRR